MTLLCLQHTKNSLKMSQRTFSLRNGTILLGPFLNCRPLEEPMPAWRRRIVTVSANCAGFVMLMLGFRVRVRGLENHKKAKELGAVSS